MKISVRQSGGYAGVPIDLGTADTAHSANGPHLEALVKQAGFFALPAEVAGDTVGADLPRYTLTVSDVGRDHTVTFTDGGEPTANPLREIVRLVTSEPQ